MRKALIAAVVVVVVAVCLFLWLAFPLRGSASLHALCLPVDWTCPLTDHGVLISTANATWWLILATGLGATATLSAVLVALGQDRRRSLGEDRERTRMNRAAKQAILNTNSHCRKAETEISLLTYADPDLAWDLYGTAEAHRRTLEHHLGTTISQDVFVYQCNATIQRLHEVRTALDSVVKDTPEDLQKAKKVLAAVVRRIAVDEPSVLGADVRVINGTTSVVVSARGSATGTSAATAVGSK